MCLLQYFLDLFCMDASKGCVFSVELRAGQSSELFLMPETMLAVLADASCVWNGIYVMLLNRVPRFLSLWSGAL